MIHGSASDLIIESWHAAKKQNNKHIAAEFYSLVTDSIANYGENILFSGSDVYDVREYRQHIFAN